MQRYQILMILLFFSSLTFGQAEHTEPFVGTFSGSGLTLTLKKTSDGYTGTIVSKGLKMQIDAQQTGDTMLMGTYALQGIPLPFQAELQGDTLVLAAEGAVYTLSRDTQNTAKPSRQQGSPQKSFDQPTPVTQPDRTTQTVAAPSLGFKFNLPPGWMANQLQTGYLLGSQTQKGFVLILSHQYSSIQDLETAAQQGIADENGTRLHLSGTIESLGENGIAAPFTGLVEWQQAKAHAISLLSPHGGGVTILAAVEEKSYSSDYEKLAEQVGNSVSFFKPEIPPVVDQWKETLTGARLTYMWNYYSGGSGGSYAGGSQTTKIDLCPQGYFNYMDRNQMAVDGGGSSGYGGGNDRGSGTWQVLSRGQQPVLRLTFHDGRLLEYALSMEEGKTFLDDKRFFRTYADAPVADHRPQCP